MLSNFQHNLRGFPNIVLKVDISTIFNQQLHHTKTDFVCISWHNNRTTTNTTTNCFMALWILSGTTRVSQYQYVSPTHTYHGHQSSLICFLHLIQSMASSPFNLRAWQSFHTICPSFLWSTSTWHPRLHTVVADGSPDPP